MRNKGVARTMVRLLEQARYEVLPTVSTEEKVLEHLPRDRTVTVTASPGKGINRIFVPGGDAEAVGDYPDALSLLEDLAALGHPFAQVGITGYPESHPTITDDLTVQSMWDKRRYATHIVSNLTFDPGVITGWVRRLRARGVTMPLLLGVPGPVDRGKLLA